MSVSITLNFDNIEELNEYLILHKKIIKKTKKANPNFIEEIKDNRGAYLVGVHKLAKIYNNSHPELSYNDCVQYVKDNYKKNLIII